MHKLTKSECSADVKKAYPAITDENKLVEHVENLKARLVYSEHNGTIGGCQVVQMNQQLMGSSGIQSCNTTTIYVLAAG